MADDGLRRETRLGAEPLEPDPGAGAALTVDEAGLPRGDVGDRFEPERIAGRQHQALLPAKQRHDDQVAVGEDGVEGGRGRTVRTVMKARDIDGSVAQPRQGVEAARDHQVDLPPRFDRLQQQRVVARCQPDPGVRRLQQPPQTLGQRQFLRRERRCEAVPRRREQREQRRAEGRQVGAVPLGLHDDRPSERLFERFKLAPGGAVGDREALGRPLKRARPAERVEESVGSPEREGGRALAAALDLEAHVQTTRLREDLGGTGQSLDGHMHGLSY